MEVQGYYRFPHFWGPTYFCERVFKGNLGPKWKFPFQFWTRTFFFLLFLTCLYSKWCNLEKLRKSIFCRSLSLPFWRNGYWRLHLNKRSKQYLTTIPSHFMELSLFYFSGIWFLISVLRIMAQWENLNTSNPNTGLL